MSDLRTELEQAAERFVTTVLDVLKGSSVNEIVDNVQDAAKAPARAAASPRAAARGRAGRQPTVVARPAAAPAKRAAAGKRHRATAEEVQQQKDIALAAAKQLAPGFSKGDVMKKSGAKQDLGRALSLLVAEGVLTKKGDRRNTRYWVK